MLRRLRQFALALSLLLVACLVLAAGRSFFAYDRLERDALTDLGGPWRRDWLRVDSNAGRLDLYLLRETRTNRAQYDNLLANTKPFRLYQRPGRHTMPTVHPWLRTLGLYAELESRPDHFFTRIILPYWLPILLLLLWPLARLYRRARPKPRAPGHCPSCGYDLRASADRCPECGTRIAVRAAFRGGGSRATSA